ncbi:Rop family plasmid primer RNA-binding protein [Escherichia coli]|nr:Rop family plasmid primer RNA-binding protein [Escherichia coli]
MCIRDSIIGEALTLVEELNEVDADEHADIFESLHDQADELYRRSLSRFGDDEENRGYMQLPDTSRACL